MSSADAFPEQPAPDAAGAASQQALRNIMAQIASGGSACISAPAGPTVGQQAQQAQQASNAELLSSAAAPTSHAAAALNLQALLGATQPALSGDPYAPAGTAGYLPGFGVSPGLTNFPGFPFALAGVGNGFTPYPAVANLAALLQKPTGVPTAAPNLTTSAATAQHGHNINAAGATNPLLERFLQHHASHGAPTPPMTAESFLAMQQLSALAQAHQSAAQLGQLAGQPVGAAQLAGQPAAAAQLAYLMGQSNFRGSTLNPGAAHTEKNTKNALKRAKALGCWSAPILVPNDIAERAACGAFVSLEEVKGALRGHHTTKKVKALPLTQEDDITFLINQVGKWRGQRVTSTIDAACGYAITKVYLEYAQFAGKLKSNLGIEAASQFDYDSRRDCIKRGTDPMDFSPAIHQEALSTGIRAAAKSLSSAPKPQWGQGRDSRASSFASNSNMRQGRKRRFHQGPGQPRPRDVDGNEVCLKFTNR